jgi:beta-glucanase (GH16 family)
MSIPCKNPTIRLSSPLSLLASALLLGFSTASYGQELIWSEEFDSGTQPNPDVWSYELGNGQDGWGNWELQDYSNSEQNVRIEDGRLIITAIPTIAGDEVVGFTSARIKTQDKLTFKYGKVEARIKVPNLERGLWPAFWTLGNNFPEVGWPACGELDILEMGMFSAISAGPGRVNQQVASAAHWESGGNYAIYNKTLDKGENLTEEFQILTMDWTPSLVTTYLNGEEIWAIDISSGSCTDCEEFHRPHFMLLNMAVGGTFTGMRSIGSITAPLPASMEVDWVRIYNNGFTELGGSALGAPDIGPAHSGSWFNAAQDGHGFSMEFSEIDLGGQLTPFAVIYWYTYDDQGNPIFMVGSGIPEGNRVEVSFESPTGMIYGDFNAVPYPRPDGGTAVFEFSDRDNATFSYTPSDFSESKWGHTTAIDNLPLVKLLGIDAATQFSSGAD